MTSQNHNAAPSALGYLYQSQWPLVDLIKRGSERPDLELSLELHDDVSWEEGGSPVELLQLKHHVDASRSLGDMSDDLWRTLAVWMDASDPGDPVGPVLCLVTTQSAVPGSACSLLRTVDRDPTEARRLLDIAATESTAASTERARGRFLGLTDGERAAFVSRVRVLDGAAPIEDLDAELREALHWGLPQGHEDTFVELLWSWWHRVAVDLLRGTIKTISALNVQAQVSDLRDKFSLDNLPTLVSREDFDPDTSDDYVSRAFIKQLEWVEMSYPLLQAAIVDYFRAYTQSVRWVDDHLVDVGELSAFEDDLKDEWERAFEYMKLELKASSDDATLAKAGRELFRAVSEQAHVRVRARYDEPFYTRGKLHELADGGHVGWHRDFEARLEALLLGSSQ